MDNIIHLIPEKWRGTVLVAVALTPYFTRGYHALVSGGGIKGIFNGIFFGTNVPKGQGPEQPK